MAAAASVRAARSRPGSARSSMAGGSAQGQYEQRQSEMLARYGSRYAPASPGAAEGGRGDRPIYWPPPSSPQSPGGAHVRPPPSPYSCAVPAAAGGRPAVRPHSAPSARQQRIPANAGTLTGATACCVSGPPASSPRRQQPAHHILSAWPTDSDPPLPPHNSGRFGAALHPRPSPTTASTATRVGGEGNRGSLVHRPSRPPTAPHRSRPTRPQSAREARSERSRAGASSGIFAVYG
jgi:hypothetical protein